VVEMRVEYPRLDTKIFVYTPWRLINTILIHS
jgi:hypothetical protein